MPRIGSTPEEQSSGGNNFRFPEGNGEIVDAKVGNHAIPGYSADCGYLLTIQGYNADWSRTVGEPVTEFLKAGPLNNDKTGDPVFRPGRAASSDDNNPQLEVGGALDCGTGLHDQDENAIGNCLLSVSRGPDKKSKLSIFTNAGVKAGIKPMLFNGFAPNLIGLRAHFTQMPMEKIPGSTAKNDPTCLIIGTNGSDAAQKVVRYPFAQVGGAAPAPAPATSTQAPTPAHNAPAPSAAQAHAAPASAPVASGDAGVGGVSDEIHAVAVAMLMQAVKPGDSLTRQKISAKLVTLLAKARVPSAQQSLVQAAFKNDAWMVATLADMDWGYDAASQTVTAPAAA